MSILCCGSPLPLLHVGLTLQNQLGSSSRLERIASKLVLLELAKPFVDQFQRACDREVFVLLGIFLQIRLRQFK